MSITTENTTQSLEDIIKANITVLLEYARNIMYLEPYRESASNEEILGSIISKFLKCTPESVFKTAYYAFEDSNCASFIIKFKELWDQEESEVTIPNKTKYSRVNTEDLAELIEFRLTNCGCESELGHLCDTCSLVKHTIDL